MSETERLMQEIRDAADAFRDAELNLRYACVHARTMGLPDSDIASAQAQALR